MSKLKVVVPQSIVDEFNRLHYLYNRGVGTPKGINATIHTEFGEIELIGKPDIEYTEENMEPVRRFKDV